MMVIDNKYEIGQLVYLVTDEEQSPRIVTSISVTPGVLVYELSLGSAISRHYELEITEEENLEMK